MAEINCTGTNTIRTAADLDIISQPCPPSSSLSGKPSFDFKNYSDETLVIPTLGSIISNFNIINNDILKSMDINNIENGWIDGIFAVKNLSNLETIQLGVGDSIDGVDFGEIFDLQNLPKLKSIATGNYTLSALSVRKSFVMKDIGDGSVPLLESLAIEFGAENCNVSLYNTNIANVTLTASDILDLLSIVQVGNITFSNPSTLPLSTISIPLVQQAREMRFANVANLSLPLLETITEDFGIGDSPLTSIDIDSLRNITGNLRFQNLTMREQLSLGSLAFVGGNFIINNTNIDGLASSPLATVGGDIYIQGNFSSLDLPSLTHVGGRMDLVSTAALDCGTLNFIKVVSQSKYSCSSSLSKSSSTTPNTTPNTTSSTNIAQRPRASGGGSSRSSKVGIIAGPVIGGTLIFALVTVLLVLWRKQRMKKKAAAANLRESVFYGRVEMEQRTGPISTMVESGGGALVEAGGEPLQLVELPDVSSRPIELEDVNSGAAQEIDGACIYKNEGVSDYRR